MSVRFHTSLNWTDLIIVNTLDHISIKARVVIIPVQRSYQYEGQAQAHTSLKAVPVRRPYQSKGLTSLKVIPVRRPYQSKGLTSLNVIPVRRPYQSKGLTSMEAVPVQRSYQYEGRISLKVLPVQRSFSLKAVSVRKPYQFKNHGPNMSKYYTGLKAICANPLLLVYLCQHLIWAFYQFNLCTRAHVYLIIHVLV
jgi:hypothetical protein